MSATVSMASDPDLVIAEAAEQFGFDSSEEFLRWMRLDLLRRANLTLRTAQDSGQFSESHSKVLDSLGNLCGRLVFGQVARLQSAGARRVRELFNIAVAHDSSPSVAGSDAGTSDATKSTVGDAADVRNPSGTSAAPSGGVAS